MKRPGRYTSSELLGPACGPRFLSRSGATQFFVHRIKAADEFGIFRYRMRSSNQVALHLVARFSGQEIELRPRFDALSQHGHTESPRQADNGTHNCRGLRTALQIRYERLVDLDLVER